MQRVKSLLSSTPAFFILVFVVYSLITAVMFNHRIVDIFTHYGMPDVDTDGGLWYQWFIVYAKQHYLLQDFLRTEGFPFGYDISLSPISNLIYSTHVLIMERMIGFSWSNLVFITNVSSLITYPLSAIGACLVCYYLTKNKAGSFVAGLIFSFSFYHVFMGRGQMSINHIEFIPFYFLSLFYFLDKKNFFSLLLSCVTFSVMFMADAYYAFFSGIFSFLVILLYKQESIGSKLKTYVIYYSSLFIVFFLVNFNFILSNLYLFDKSQAAATGRNSPPRNELTTILYYFVPLKFNLVYDKLYLLSGFLYNLTLIISIAGIIFLKKNRLLILFLLCFLLAIVLSAYIPSLYWINIIYFKFFGMFRGVGRLALPAYLFLGLLVGMTISAFMLTNVYKTLSKKLVILLYTLLCFIIVLTSLSVDATWYRNTDFSKIAQVYEPIKKNDNLHVLALYPFDLNFQDTGFPQPYQLLGQIVHNKPLANGASLGSSVAAEYQRKIRDIKKPETIDALKKYGVDTIVVYNNLLKDAEGVHKRLRSDERVTFVGRYTAPRDKMYQSANDLSRDISVYQLKDVTTNTKPLLYTLEGNKVTYEKINEGKYLIAIHDVKKPVHLVYNYPYSEKWELLTGDLSKVNEASLLTKKEDNTVKQQRYQEYANLWEIERPQEMTLYWQPQARNYLGFLISTTTLSICFFILSIYILRKIVLLYFRKK